MSRNLGQEIERVRKQIEPLRALATELAQEQLATGGEENASGVGVGFLGDGIQVVAAFGEVDKAAVILQAAERCLLAAREEPADLDDEEEVYGRLEEHLGLVVTGALLGSQRRWRDLGKAVGLGSWLIERVKDRCERSRRRRGEDAADSFQLQYLGMVAVERLWGVAKDEPAVKHAIELPIQRRYREVRSLIGKVALGEAMEDAWKAIDTEVLELVGPHAYDVGSFSDLRPIEALMLSAVRWRGDLRAGAEKMFLE